jgi:hypothetical protein
MSETGCQQKALAESIAPNQGTLEIVLPDIADRAAVITVKDFARATPLALLQTLSEEQVLPPADASRPYIATVDGRQLNPQQSLAEQGVAAGMSVRIERLGMGAFGGVVEVHSPDVGGSLRVPVNDFDKATPAALAGYLQQSGMLPPEDSSRRYMFFADGQRLNPTLSFATQGVVADCILQIERETTGAGVLSAADMSTRRALDHGTMVVTFPQGGPIVTGWQAFSSVAEAERDRPTRNPAMASVYEVILAVKAPAGPRSYRSSWLARIDASSSSYPFAAAGTPSVAFLGSPKPWLPHVDTGGAVCMGSLWSPSRLLANLVVDLVRMLNFDENLQKLRAAQAHFNPESIEWWVRVHDARPITNITYPVVQAAGAARGGCPFGPISGAGTGGSLFGPVRSHG